MKDNKMVCKGCRENKFSKGMKELYPKVIMCQYCKEEIIGYRRLTKKEKTQSQPEVNK